MDLLRKNLSLKIMAVLIAFGLWAWVTGQADVIKTVRVPIDFSGLPADLEIVGDPLDDVTVRLRGSEIALRTLPEERVRLRVSLGNIPLGVGVNAIPLGPDQVTVPAGVRVDRLTPNVLNLELEHKANMEVPVEPAIRGEPADGFEVAGTVVQPPRLLIEGPESAVRSVGSLATPAIPIDGQTSNQSLRVRPIVVGPSGTQVRLADPSATVQVLVRIRPIQMERTLDGVQLAVRGRAAGKRQPQVDVSTVQVEVSGPRETVERLDAGALVAVLDISGLTPEVLEVDAPGLAVVPLDPEAPPWQDLRFQVTAPATIRLNWNDAPAS